MVGSFQVPAAGETWYVKVVAVDGQGLKSQASGQTTAVPNLIINANIENATITDAKINSLSANKIVADSTFTNDLNVASKFTLGTDTTDGVIESYGYGAGTGFRLADSGLIINEGSISARTLDVQLSDNVAHPAYSDFQFVPSYYDNMYKTGGVINVITNGAKYGSQYLSARSEVGGAYNFALAQAVDDYNIDIEAGETYIVSAWVKTGDVDTDFSFRMVFDDTSTTAWQNDLLAANGVWERHSFVTTIPAGVAKGYIEFAINTIDVGAGMDIDGVQIEKKTSDSDEPSVWSPPSYTLVDGGAIRTGEIRSAATTTVNGTEQPLWSINTQGNAQFGGAYVRGKIIVGEDGTDLDNGESAIRSGNYVQGTTGWKLDSAGNLEANSGEFRGVIEAAEFIGQNFLSASGGSIIAGDPLGAHAEMNETGFVSYAPGDIDGEPNEIIRIGSEGSDTIGVSGPTGDTLASIDNRGFISGTGGSFGKSEPEWEVDENGDRSLVSGLEVYGKEFNQIIDNMPRGIRQYVNLSANYGPYATEAGYMALQFTIESGRMYRIGYTARTFPGNSATAVVSRIRGEIATSESSTAPEPTTSSPVLIETVTHKAGPGTQIHISQSDFGLFRSNPGELDNYDCKLLLTMQSAGGNGDGVITSKPWGNGGENWLGNITPGGNSPTAGSILYVEDIGPAQTEDGSWWNGYYSAGGAHILSGSGGNQGPTDSAIKKYKSTWVASNSQTYKGGGGSRNDTNDLVQGYNGANGNGYAYVVFNDDAVYGEKSKTISQALTNASIVRVEVYLYANHWWYNSGGTAIIRPWNSSSLSNATPQGSYRKSSNWPKPGGRWVDITSITTINVNGIRIGPGLSNDLRFYGRFNGHTGGGKPRIRITYKR